MLLLIAVIWGMCFPMTKVALKAGMSSIQVMRAKFLLGAIVASVIFHKHVREMRGNKRQRAQLGNLL